MEPLNYRETHSLAHPFESDATYVQFPFTVTVTMLMQVTWSDPGIMFYAACSRGHIVSQLQCTDTQIRLSSHRKQKTRRVTCLLHTTDNLHLKQVTKRHFRFCKWESQRLVTDVCTTPPSPPPPPHAPGRVHAVWSSVHGCHKGHGC